MQQLTYDVVVVGAGIAGITAAHALIEAGAGRVAILEDGPPLGLTSDKSTECYRNYWPGPDDAMLRLVSDSIDHMTELAARSGDRFQLRQHGYLFATARSAEIDAMAASAAEVERFGGGRLRHHPAALSPNPSEAAYRPAADGMPDATLNGSDLITDSATIRHHFPYLSDTTKAVLHVRRCGTLSAQQLGMYLLEEARAGGADLIAGTFTGIETAAGHISQVTCLTADGPLILNTSALVLATGPHLGATARTAGAVLPVLVEKHIKISLSDRLGIIPRNAPLIIWNDPVDLPWSDEERAMLAESPETRRLTETFPAGVHGRPVGAGDQVLMYWTYDCAVSEQPEFPLTSDPYLPEVTLRGMAAMVPGLEAYIDPMPKPYVDGGYYTKTPDNRPLIGPLQVPGTFVTGAFSGFGIMASCAAGKLLAAHVLGTTRPSYSPAFEIGRFNDPAYVARIADQSATAQL